MERSYPTPLTLGGVKRTRWLMMAILLLAVTIRLSGLGTESAWIDEAYSMVLAQHPIFEIIQGTAADQHPPLYYLILHFWLFFGSGVAFARFLSLLIGVIHIALTMQLGRMLGSETIGLGAGLLLTLSPMHVWYSQEIRMYILLAALTTAATTALWLCLNGKNRWFLYWLFSLLSIYTQYFAVFILVAHGALVLAWALLKRERKNLLRWGIAMILLLVGFTPWLPIALMQTREHTLSWIGPTTVNLIRDTFLKLLLGNAILILPPWGRWAILAIITSAVFLATKQINRQKMGAILPFGFLATWSLLPYLTIITISLTYPILQLKQFLILLGPFLLWMTWVATSLPRRWGHWLFVSLLLFSSSSLMVQQATYNKDDWRGVAAAIQVRSTPGDLVYSNPAAASLPLELYWDTPLPQDGYPLNYDILSGGWEGKPLTPEIVSRFLQPHSTSYTRLWLVEFFPEFWDADQILATWLNEHGHLITDEYFGRVRVRLFQFKDNNGS